MVSGLYGATFTDEEYDAEARKNKERLIPKLTREFLSTLSQAGRTIGWSVDYVEVHSFIRECFALAEVEPPEDIKKTYMVLWEEQLAAKQAAERETEKG